MRILLLIVLSVFVIGCGNEKEEREPFVQSIRVDVDTVPRRIYYDELDISLIAFDVTYSDGEVKRLYLNELPLSQSQENNLMRPGVHTFNIEYEKRMAYFTLELLDPYEIRIVGYVDENAEVESKSTFMFNDQTVYQVTLKLTHCDAIKYTTSIDVEKEEYETIHVGDFYAFIRPVEAFRRESEEKVKLVGENIGYEFVQPDEYYIYVAITIDNKAYEAKVPVSEEDFNAFKEEDMFEFERDLWKE